MVDYHYIKRGNKIYGPYYYRSYRVGDKVKKEYLGKDFFKKKQQRKNNLAPLLILLFSCALILFLINLRITGKASLQLETTEFLANEPIAGNLSIMLKQGELIPAETDVTIQVSNETYAKTEKLELKKFMEKSGLNIQKEQGDFYIENVGLAGEGQGYGIVGSMAISPFVYFILQATAIEETGRELLEQIDASVVSGQSFIYESRNETAVSNVNAMILDKSAYYYDDKGNKESLDKDALNLEINQNRVIVTTNYSYQVAGFGQDFLSENLTTLSLNLSSLDFLVSEPGMYNLKISLSYENTSILQISDDVNIKPSNLTVNYAPYLLQEIPSQTLHAGTNISINLADYFADDDKGNLSYTSTHPENLQITITNSIATITAGNWLGSEIVKFNASDSINENESNAVGIKATNNPPALARDIPAINITINRNETLNLSWYFEDADNDTLTFSSTQPENIIASITRSIATLQPDENFVGTRSTIFYASDGINTTASNLMQIEVAVSVVNHAPVQIATIPNQTIYANEEASINLQNYFADGDKDNLTYNLLQEGMNLAIFLNSETGHARIVPETDFTGVRSITFYASDGIAATPSNLVEISIIEKSVEKINHAPKLLQNIPAVKIFKNESAALNLSEYFNDADDDALAFTSSSAGNLTISIEGATARIVPDENFVGTRSITFYASDNINTTASNHAIINITDAAAIVNHAPQLASSIPDIYIKQNLNKTINLLEYFRDADNDKLVFSADNTENISITISGNTAFIEPDKNWIGTGSMQFHASDGIAIAESNIILINVAQNYIPMLTTPIPGIVIRQDSDYLLNLASFFTQNDDDALTFTSSSAENIKVNITGSMARLTPDINFTGIRSITFYASDGIAATPSNLMQIEVKSMNVTEITTQYNAVVGKPVEWSKKILLAEPENVTVKLPIEATNITVSRIVNEREQPMAISLAKITGDIVKVPAAEERKNLFSETINMFSNFFAGAGDKTMAITGYAIANENQLAAEFQQEVQKLKNAGYEEIQLELAEKATEYEITYTTPAPQAEETETGAYKKQVTVFSALHYQNVTAFTEMPDIVPLSKPSAIDIYWLTTENKTTNFTEIQTRDVFNATTNQTERITEVTETSITETIAMKKPVSFIAYDANGNGYIDRIEWQVPSLSNQTYGISITMINVRTYPTLYGNWTVYFNTTGEADLRITALDGTTWNYHDDSCGSDLCQIRFENMTCGSTLLAPTWLQNSEDGSNNSVFYANYSCSEQGSETSIVLRAAMHTLKFQFGSGTAYAYNQVPGAWYSENVSFQINLAPTIAYAAPTENNNTNFSRAWIAVNVTVGETEQNITFLLYNTTGQVNKTVSTSQLRFVNWTGLPDGNYSYNVTARDSVNNRNTTATRTISLDANNPLVDYAAPTENNNTNVSRSWIFVNVSVTESNFANITFNIYNSAHSIVNSTNYTTRIYFINWTGLSDGTYYYNVTVGDSFSNKNSTATRRITLDATSPAVAYAAPTPADATNISISSAYVNITYNETNYQSITFYLYNSDGTLNEARIHANATNFTNFTGLSETTYVFGVTVNDTANNKAALSNRTVTINFWYSENASFKIDRVPVINWTVPANLNESIFNRTYGYNQNINATDYALKEMNCTIYSDANLTQALWSVSINITGNTSYVKASLVNTSNWQAGVYYEKCQVTDIPV